MMKKLFAVLTGSLIAQFALAQCVASFTPSPNPVCQGQPVTFVDLSSGATGVVTYNWNFGAGAVPATSTLQNPPPVTYTTPGAKTVTLTYAGTGGGGCSVTATQIVTVNATPVATFASSAPQCLGTGINFTNTGTSGAGVSYMWDFGSGSNPATSNAQNPTNIQYTTAGQKLVTFTIDNGSCTTVDTMTILINATPTASFTSNAPQCQTNAVNFSNTGTVVGVTWAWNFGVGAVPATSVVQNPAGITYTSPGIKTISLTTTNIATGCNVTTTQNIVIDATPVAAFTSNAPQCTGNNVNFTNTGTAVGVVYSWSFGAGATPAASTAQNPVGVTYSTAGPKTVTFTVTNPTTGCFATTTQIININASPVASFSSNAPQCTGSNVNFTCTGTVGGGITYNWNFGAGAVPATSVVQNPAGVVYSTSGTKFVSFTVTNSVTGCSSTTIQTININQSPTATFASNAPQCEGSAVNFTNTGTTGAGVSYNWNFGPNSNPNNSTAENPSGIMYSGSGDELITFTVTNGGCTAVDTMSIYINPAPVSTWMSNAPQCTGSNVNFTCTGSSGPNFTYSWNFGAGAVPATSTAQNPSSVVYSVSGAATVSLMVTNSITGCTSTTIQNININQAPTATFNSSAPTCQNTAVSFTNTGTTGGGVTYSWDFGMNATPQTSNAESPSGVMYSTPGPKLITYSIDNGSCVTVDTMTIMVDSTPVASYASNAPRCMGDSVTFLNTGTNNNATFLWNFGPNGNPLTSIVQNPTGILFTTAGAQTINLTVTSLTTGCSATTTKIINIYQPPVATFTSNTPACAGTSINFTNTGSSGAGVTYTWDFGMGAMPNVSTAESPSGIMYPSGGMKRITYTVNNGLCTAVDTMSIAIDSLPMAEAGRDTMICSGDTLQIGAASVAGYKYKWWPKAMVSNDTISNPVARPNVSGPNMFIVTVTSPKGCVTSDTINIKMLAPLVANAGMASSLCKGDSIQLGVTVIAGQKYSWSPSLGISDTDIAQPYAKPASTTLYTLSVTGMGCPAATGMVLVTVNPSPATWPHMWDTIGMGTSVQLNASGGVQYLWMPSTGLSNASDASPMASPDSTTLYIVTVTSLSGCSSTDSVTVVVNPNNLWAPSAFTPNADGKDDIFYIHGEGITNFSLGVYNRWGEQIFHSEDIHMGWDGTRQISGEKLPDGAYVYYVKGTDATGKAVNMKGMINLIR
jgi:gliding motility-associated-like protein